MGFSPWDVLPAFAISLIAVVLARLFGQRAGALVPLAIGIGFAASFKSITGAWPGWPVRSAIGWLFYAAPASGLIAGIATLFRKSWLPSVVAFALSATTAALLLQSKISAESNRSMALMSCFLIGIAAAVWTAIIFQPFLAKDSRLGGLILVMNLLIGAGLMMVSGSIAFSRFGIAIAAAVVPLLLFARTSRVCYAIIGVVVILNLLLASWWFSELTTQNFFLMLAAPVPIVLGSIRKLQWKQPLLRFSFFLMVAAVLPLIAFVPAAYRYYKDLENEGYTLFSPPDSYS